MLIQRAPRHLVGAGVALVLGLAACGSSSSTGSAGATPTIKLAVSGPMTGDAAADGLHMKQGADLALDEINGAGGITSGKFQGARLTIDYLDDKETVDGSVSNANKVVSDDSYWAFLGTGFSDAAIATAPVLDAAGVSFLSTYASSDLIIAKPKSNVFIVPPTFPAYAFSAAEKTVALGFHNAGLLVANAGFGTHMADLYAQHLGTLGAAVADRETYELGTKDVQGPVSKVLAKQPDIVALAGLTGDDVALIKQLRASGFNGPIIDLEAVLFSQDFLTAAGSTGEGVVGQTPSDPQRAGAAATAFRNAFKAKYSTDIVPDPAAFTYEAVKAVARALEASPPDRSGLGAALHAVTIDDTGVGKLSFDPTGARLGVILWYFAVEAGSFSFVDGYQQTAAMAVQKVALQR
jgi:branched-chain amino acid transport system substrate-binding protein